MLLSVPTSRANHCFAEVGDLELNRPISRNAMRGSSVWAKMQGKHPLAFLAWKRTSSYSTSISPWTTWIMGTIMLFSLLSEIFFRVQWLLPMSDTNHNQSALIPLWSGFYYAINVTSSLALVEYPPTHPIAQASLC